MTPTEQVHIVDKNNYRISHHPPRCKMLKQNTT